MEGEQWASPWHIQPTSRRGKGGRPRIVWGLSGDGIAGRGHGGGYVKLAALVLTIQQSVLFAEMAAELGIIEIMELLNAIATGG